MHQLLELSPRPFDLQVPPQINMVVSDPEFGSMSKLSFEKRANREVNDARGIVAACGSEMLWGTLKQMRSSAIV